MPPPTTPGPAVLISFVLAGIVAGLTALCYAELASMIPAAGSTYSYAFAAFGSFVGWFIGWDLLLEYLFAASTVAVGWSGYFVSLMRLDRGPRPARARQPAVRRRRRDRQPAGAGDHAPHLGRALARHPRVGARQQRDGAAEAGDPGRWSSAIGVFYVSSSNLTPFVPAHTGGFGDFGWTGVFRGAGIVFFAYIGFDAVSTAAAEARNPRRTIPIGLLGTVLISTVLYIAVGFVLTGMLNYRSLGVADPIAAAIHSAGPNLDWLLRLTDVAAVVGLASTVLVTLYGQTRIFMRMSEDGMLPPRFGKVSRRRKTPQFSIVLCGDRRRHRRRAGAALGARRTDLDRHPARLHHRLQRRPRPAPPLPRPARGPSGCRRCRWSPAPRSSPRWR